MPDAYYDTGDHKKVVLIFIPYTKKVVLIIPALTSSNQGVEVSCASSDSIHSSGMISGISNQNLQGVEKELSFVQREMEKSVVYMLGEE
ncbi:potassium transporter [Trifolium repens]|jgi:hypothetical protein|nr:potassium transporter [Trifolium repens]